MERLKMGMLKVAHTAETGDAVNSIAVRFTYLNYFLFKTLFNHNYVIFSVAKYWIYGNIFNKDFLPRGIIIENSPIFIPLIFYI